MRILITNDDGIDAPGLKILYIIAQALAGARGEVWTVAPNSEQSGVGHCVSFVKPFQITQRAAREVAVDGYPADCVLVALHEIMTDAPPDLVLSGVNRGNNSAENATYSGTLGAVMEAALQGVRGIALSQYLGTQNIDLENCFEAAATHGLDLIKRLLEVAPWEDDAHYQIFYNVNFPPLPADKVKGIKIVPQGLRKKGAFSLKPAHAPMGRRLLWLQGSEQRTYTNQDSDVAANMDDFISVTPMRIDLSAHDLIAPLSRVFE